MSRRYQHADVARTQRVMQALLPVGVRVATSSISDGWELSIVVCGATACEPYVFAPGVTDKQLLVIADQWSTGSLVRPIGQDKSEVLRRVLRSEMITNRNDFATWCRESKRQTKVAYFRGVLSQFRFDAPRRLVQLQGLADEAKPSRPRPQSEAVEAAKLRETLDLLELVTLLHDAKSIELVQHRLADGTGATYYAVKR